MGLDARHLDERPAGYEGEAILAELAETVELQAYTLASLHKQIDRLEAEREQLRDELHMAHAWIRELAAELELAVAQAAEPLTRRVSSSCSRSQTPSCCHSSSRRQQVEPEPKPSSAGRCRQAIPVCRTKRIPRDETDERP